METFKLIHIGTDYIQVDVGNEVIMDYPLGILRVFSDNFKITIDEDISKNKVNKIVKELF